MRGDVAGRGKGSALIGVGTDQAVGHVTKGGEVQICLGFGGEQNGEIQGTCQQIKAHLVGIVRFDIESAIGQAGAKLRHPVADHACRQIILNAKAQGDRSVTLWRNPAARFKPFVAQGAGVGFKPQALGGQVRARARPCEQARIKGGFKGRNPPRHGGLGDAKPFGAAVEAAGFNQVEEGFDQLYLHIRS